MKYRWGFIDENDTFTECYPIVEDSTAITYAQQAEEIFYRAKLNGSLDFRFEFADILAQGYNVEHVVVLQWYDADNDVWGEIWRGRFSLTDCTIDYDSNTISVEPETIDRYTKILDDWKKEYNLVKLAPAMQPVDILIRPLIQMYEIFDSKISNYVGNYYWEANCTPVERNDIDNYKFGLQQQYISAVITYADNAYSGTPYAYRGGKTIAYVGEVIYGGLPQENTRVYGQYWDGASWQTDTLRVRVAQMTTYTYFLFFGLPETSGENQQKLFQANYIAYGMGTAPEIVDIYAPLVAEAQSQWDMICMRILCQTELSSITIQGNTYTLDDIPSNDMAGSNLNYNKVFYAPIAEIKISGDVQDEPTQWGKTINDKYFVKPTDSLGLRWMPVGQSLWRYFSVWYRITNVSMMNTINNQLTAYQTIADSYRLDKAAMKLLEKAGWTGTYWISRALAGNNDYVGDSSFIPVITPKSNVISSYYNSPAQNAPISLEKIFTMLKQAYRCYWYIDDNNNIHVEHISYFDNGYSYTESAPSVLIDLESVMHTNTKEHKAYGQNKVSFDKDNMPDQFTFGWMDEQTTPFEGYPINCLDKYVNKGVEEQNTIGSFDTDVDFVLSSPNDVTKDGFFLFLVPTHNGNVNWAMEIESVRVYDVDGNPYDALIQNADGAFVKIHKSWWRYALPCENVNINNEDTTAITTGKYKVQSVEFADVTMAQILKNISNCNLVFRTQQGDGHIKSLSINLNSLTAKADLLFNFVGRWYYLKGAAIGASIAITINGEQVTIDVSNNSFIYRYKDAISSLTFDSADVVSVNFADADSLDNLTSCDDMFKNCTELIAVDFGGKKMSAVLSANDMFEGCANLTTLICPDTSTWKADLDFSDCPNLTTDSLYDLIKYLYVYDSGVHTITPNTTMWQSLDGAVQDDLIAKAAERGWTIGVAAQYSIVGQSAANTVYATINGTPVEIPVTAGSFQYDYNTPITSISFEGDADVTDIDFSLSDGLAGLTSLNDAFKDCAGLTSVDFTNCDLSNVTSASNAFANCGALYTLEIPTDTWLPDIDLSASVMPKSEMLNVINGLYTYASGTHTITFNSTIWDAMSVADQQAVWNAADAKGWTTNAVAVVYYIRGTSSNVNGTETFNIQFIDDDSLTPSSVETISVSVAADGKWEYSYVHKKIYSLHEFALSNSTLLTCDFSAADDFMRLSSMNSAFRLCANITDVVLGTQTFQVLTTLNNAFYHCEKLLMFESDYAQFGAVTNADRMFEGCTSITDILLPSATFAQLTSAQSMFEGTSALTNTNIASANFVSLTNAQRMFYSSKTTPNLSNMSFASLVSASNMFAYCKATNIDLTSATFANATMNLGFYQCTNLVELKLNSATFTNATSGNNMFYNCNKLTTLSMPLAVFSNVGNIDRMFERMSVLTTLSMPSATFAKVASSQFSFASDSALTTIDVTQDSTAILKTSSASIAYINLSSAPLTYTSMLKVANWLSDLTGQSAHTCTFKTSAWNALSSAEQATIQGILSGKNWNLATA